MARYAYADPIYPGMKDLYVAEAAADGRVASEINHPLLVTYLCDEYPDGWALSTSSVALRYVLNLCPDDVRIGAWTKPFASFKPNVNPGYCWEPVIWRGGRQPRDRSEATVRDFCAVNITLRKGVPGAKPIGFTRWVLDLLGVGGGDTVDDLFPGSGMVQEAIDGYLNAPITTPGTLFTEASDG